MIITIISILIIITIIIIIIITIIIIIIIRLKQCNKQLLGIAFGVTLPFVDNHRNASKLSHIK